MMPGLNPVLSRFVLCFALLLVAAGFWFLQTYGAARPNVVPATAPQVAFSAERAEQVLARLLGPEKPHPVSSDENARLRGRIIRELSALNLRPFVLRSFACRPHDYGVLICATINDVVAEVEPGRGKAIVLLAHYDSVPAGPGAADDQSGVATVIETARSLVAQGFRGRHPVVAVLTDGEEADLLGAAAFLQNPRLKARVGAVVNVEARGNRGPSLLFQTSAGDGPLVDLYARSVPEYATSSLYHEIYRFLPNDTDLTLFIADGFPSYNFAFVGGVADYHTANDVRARLNPVSLQQHGNNMLGLVNGLEKVDLAQLSGADAIYFDILGRWLPRAPAAFAIPLALLAFLGVVAAVFLTKAQRSGWRVWLRGFAIIPALVLLALCSGFLLHAVASLISGMPDPAYAHPAAFRIALAFALGGSALLVSELAPAAVSELAVWLWLSGMGVAVASLLPGLSPYFLLPSCVAAIMLVISARRSRDAFRIGAVLFAALVALLVWSSIGTLGEMIMGLKLHPLFTVPFAFALATIVPLLSRCALPRSLWIGSTVALFALAIVAAAFQGFEPAFSTAAAQRLSITYLQDRTRAFWAVDGEAAVPKQMRAVANFLPSPQRIPGIAPAAYVAMAGRTHLPVSTATIVARPPVNGLRKITLMLHGSGADQVYIVLPKVLAPVSIDIDSRHFSVPRAWKNEPRVAIFCMSRDCADANITLTAASRSAANVTIYYHQFGLPEFARPLVKTRPPTAVPSQNGDGVTLISTVLIPTAR